MKALGKKFQSIEKYSFLLGVVTLLTLPTISTAANTAALSPCCEGYKPFQACVSTSINSSDSSHYTPAQRESKFQTKCANEMDCKLKGQGQCQPQR